jgi:hypothetical protein
MSTMNLSRTRTWSSLWRQRASRHEQRRRRALKLFHRFLVALKHNFAEWQQRAVLRRLERTAADIEASRVFWHEDVS